MRLKWRVKIIIARLESRAPSIAIALDADPTGVVETMEPLAGASAS
jgi:hypothetical protein